MNRFNVKCPRIPEHFADEIAGQVIKAYLTGTAEISIIRELPPVELTTDGSLQTAENTAA